MVALTGIESVCYQFRPCHPLLSVSFCVHLMWLLPVGFVVYLRGMTTAPFGRSCYDLPLSHRNNRHPEPRALSSKGASHPAYCGVGSSREILKRLKEGRRLAHKQTTGGQEPYGTHGRSIRFCWPDNRTHGERPAQERAGLRHDQVRLKVFSAKRRSYYGPGTLNCDR